MKLEVRVNDIRKYISHFAEKTHF